MRLTSLGLYSFELQNYLKIIFVPKWLLQNIFNISKFSKSHQKKRNSKVSKSSWNWFLSFYFLKCAKILFGKYRKAWRYCNLLGRPGSLKTPGSHGGPGSPARPRNPGGSKGLRGSVKLGEVSSQSGKGWCNEFDTNVPKQHGGCCFGI